MNIKNILEEYRVASLLSEKLSAIKIGNLEPMIFFNGYIIPLRIAIVLFIWIKTGTDVHHRHVSKHDLNLIQALNPTAEKFVNIDLIIPNLKESLLKVGTQWIDDNINAILHINAINQPISS